MVTCLRVLKYVDDLRGALDELVRVLRPGGLLVVEHANGRSLARLGYPGSQLRFTTASELRSALSAAGCGAIELTGGMRLPHPVWRHVGARGTGALLAAERIATTALGSCTGARSLLAAGVRR